MAMANYYSKPSAILLFALLQCFSPLLHAHFDSESHGLSGGIHQHEAVELYCLDGEQTHCPNAQVQALDTQGVATTLTLPKKPSNAIDVGALAFRLSLALAQTRLAAAPRPAPPFHAGTLPHPPLTPRLTSFNLS